jgi:hypothetical protein
VASAVYQLSKLRILEFYYDCIDHYIDRHYWQYLEMDTDSAYMDIGDDGEEYQKIEVLIVNYHDEDDFADILNVNDPQEINDPEFLIRLGAIFTNSSMKEGNRLSEIIFNNISSINAEYEPFRRTDEDNIKYFWSEGFQIFQLFILYCHYIGNLLSESRNQRRNEDNTPPNDLVLEALIRLQGNAVRMGKEILVLMRAGYPDGAFARWRSIHEHCVFAFFIKEHGNATAERFLLHHYADSLISLKRYKNSYSSYNKEYPSIYFDISEIRDDEERMEQIVSDLCNRYEDNYRKPYGWAANALGITNIKEPITIAKIEASIKWDHIRPTYTLASYPVHATSKSINFFLHLFANLTELC